ncbi:MAG: FG-GAP-like repeat-containing protein [Pyrinomonadaceae bacterium]|nr:FG-GAP-like repeat-containing protein [Pyrinomonadaceae bacterium]
MLYQIKKSFALFNHHSLLSSAKSLMVLTTIFLLLSIITKSQSFSPQTQINADLRDGLPDTNFAAVVSQNRFSPGVSDVYPLPDGKILVAGGFKVVNGIIKTNLARINTDGTVDNSFSVTLFSTNNIFPETIIRKVLVQPDGKILIGGTFNIVNNVPANNLARLNSDGSIDTTFNIGTGFSDSVNALALQSDGKILAGGNFTIVNGVSKSYLARIDANGTLDTSFNPVIATFITFPIVSILPTADGKYFVQGRFYQVSGASRQGFAKLNADGSLDNSFGLPSFTVFNNISTAALQTDGKLVIGGSFELRVNNQVVNQNLVRLNSDGTYDPTLTATFNSNTNVDVLRIQNNGKLSIKGSFQTVNGVARNRLARLNTDGSLDQSFNPSLTVTGDILGFTPLDDGNSLIYGAFTNINGITFENLAKLDNSGNIDATFRPYFAGLGVLVDSFIQPDGKIVVAGEFNRANGVLSGRIARFNPDGTLDQSFNATITSNQGTQDERVNKIGLQADGKIIIGGNFSQVNGETRRFLARLNADGSVDSSFNPVLTFQGSGGGNIFAISVQADGKIIIGGAFQTVNGTARLGFARLNSDGTLDTAFNTPIEQSYAPSVNAILTQPNGKILIGGDFKFTGSNTTLSLVQLNSDGSLDTAFNNSVNPNTTPYLIWSIVKQADGKILLGGSWDFTNRPLVIRLNTDGSRDTTFNVPRIGFGFTSDRIYSIVVQPNGKVVIGGSFSIVGTIQRSGVVRLTDNGALDFSFNTPQFRSENTSSVPIVFTLNQTANNKLIVAGAFSRIGDNFVSGIARLQINNVMRQPFFDYDGDGRDDLAVFRPANANWYIQNSQNGFSATQFGIQTDKVIAADFDGDGRSDVAVFRDGNWYWLNSSNGNFSSLQFGISGDIPVPADYDGDGKSDQAVYRNGIWYILQSQAGFVATPFGNATDKPVVGDFDGDGKADQAVFRAAEGYWYLNTSAQGVKAVQFGIATDKLVAADYDGDGKTDIAVYRDGNWYRLNSSNNQFVAVPFGIANDLAVPADYDGDGKADVAVFRNGSWYILQSGSGFTAQAFGVGSDQPLANTFVR